MLTSHQNSLSFSKLLIQRNLVVKFLDKYLVEVRAISRLFDTRVLDGLPDLHLHHGINVQPCQLLTFMYGDVDLQESMSN